MRSMKIPERFTGTIYVCAYSDPLSPLYGLTTIREEKPDDNAYGTPVIELGSIDVDIPLDSKGTTDRQVEQLRQSKQKIIDEATDRANQIDEAIESLLAIEHKEEA